MRLLTLAIGLLVIVDAVTFSAQARFGTEIELVSLGVTVVDRKGNLVTDLTKDDVEIHEDGKAQSVRHFTRGAEAEDVPLRVGLLFDTSGSMVDDIQLSRSAAIKFLNALPDAEDMTFVEFDTEVRIARYSQEDFARLVERIRRRRPDGFTALYDALGAYLADASGVDGRKVLVIYTDGGDTRSSISWWDTMNVIKASDVTIYPVGFLEHQSPSTRLAQQRTLQQIAEMTGGQAFFPQSGKDVDGAYAKVLAELQAQYTVGYVSTNTETDGRWRKIDIKLKRPELKNAHIRSRPGYFARFRPSTRSTSSGSPVSAVEPSTSTERPERVEGRKAVR